jgi:hypothetical protein
MGDEGMPIEETTLKAEPDVSERQVSVSNSTNTANGSEMPKEIDDAPDNHRNLTNPFSRTQTAADVADYFVRCHDSSIAGTDAKT